MSGLSTEPSAEPDGPIRVERVPWSDGREVSVTVIGKPVWAVTAKLADQPPATASTRAVPVAAVLPSLPKGSS